jgi:putative flavoprotein involved in K+ transport
MSSQPAIEHRETIVIGAGQTGLAAGYHLTRHGIDHAILEGSERVGDVWRARYDSLRLYSPARWDGLPGMPFPGEGRAFPTGRQMADYLESYARQWDLPVRTGVRVERLDAVRDGFAVMTGSGTFRASFVIVATGGFQRPYTPALAGELDPGIVQVHAADYRSPAQLPAGPVLVVGVSHSGSDIAMELSAAHTTYLSGPDRGQLPFSVESRAGSLFLPVLELVFSRLLTLDTPIGRRAAPKVRRHGGLLLRHRRGDLRRAGVQWSQARTTGVTDGKPTLDDGTVLDVASVVWCTGYRPDYSWIDLPILDADGWPRQRRGVITEAPGLYVLGMPFLHSFASMLVLGAGSDAEHVVDHLRNSGAERRASMPMAA